LFIPMRVSGELMGHGLTAGFEVGNRRTLIGKVWRVTPGSFWEKGGMFLEEGGGVGGSEKEAAFLFLGRLAEVRKTWRS